MSDPTAPGTHPDADLQPPGSATGAEPGGEPPPDPSPDQPGSQPEDQQEAEAPVDEAAEAEDPAVLRARLAEVEAERDAYLDQLQRARADYDNLNKRKTRELMEALDRGAASVVEGLLGVLDTFAMALEAARATDDEQLSKGVEMVHGQLMGVLTEAGLEVVPGVGAPFSPEHHEALLHEADEDERDHPVVTEVLRTGYRFKGRVLRPASVKVTG